MNSNHVFGKIICFFVLSLCSLQFLAQNEKNTFRVYAKFLAHNLDIEWKKPKGFIDLKRSTTWGPSTINKGAAFSYRASLQSADGNCLIMYPDINILLDNKMTWSESLPRIQMFNEICQALGPDNGKNLGLEQQVTSEFDQYFKMLMGKDAKKKMNADTVFIAQLPLRKPYLEKYLYCTGIYVCKQKRPPMFFKLFFNEKGKYNEDIYLNSFYKAVNYRNENWILDRKKFDEESYGLYLKTNQ